MKAKPLIALVAIAGVLGLALWGYTEAQKERAVEAERERPVKAPSRVYQESGQPVVSLDQPSQKKSGLVITPQKSVSHRQEQQAFATVLPLVDLIGVRSAYMAAKVQVDKAHAALQASRLEYERLKALYTGERDVSTKALQAGEATWRADEAVLRGAQEALDAADQTARQQWGNALTKAAVENSPLFARLVTQKEVLVQVVLPAGMPVAQPPQIIRFQSPGGEFQPATLIGAAPRTDSRLQGVSFFYATSAAGLLPGMALTAYLPLGPELQGTVIPASAVVWWQSHAWVYTQKSTERFVRRDLPTDSPMDGGWFVRRDFAAGEPVVTTGSQLLLSEEQRSQISVGEEGK